MDSGSTGHSNYDMKKNIQVEKHTSGSSFWGFSEEEFLSLKKVLDSSFENERKSQANFLEPSQELNDHLDLDTEHFKPDTFILQGKKDTVSNIASEMSCSMPEIAGVEVRSGSKSCSVLELPQTYVTDSSICNTNQAQFVEIHKKDALSTNNFWDIPRKVLYENDADNVDDETVPVSVTENEKTRLENENGMLTSRTACLFGFKKLNLYSQSDQRLVSGYSENTFDDKIGKKCENSTAEEIISGYYENSFDDKIGKKCENSAEEEIISGYSENSFDDKIGKVCENSAAEEIISGYYENSFDDKIGKKCKNSAEEEIVQSNISAESSDEDYKSATSSLSESDSEKEIPIPSTVTTSMGNGRKNHMPDSDFYSTKDETATFSENETRVSLETLKALKGISKSLNDGSVCKSNENGKNSSEKNTMIKNNDYEAKLFSSDEETKSFYLDKAFDTDDEECCLVEDYNGIYVHYKSSKFNKNLQEYHKHSAFRDVSLQNIKKENFRSDEEITLSQSDKESEEDIPPKIKQKCEDQVDIPSNEKIISSHFVTDVKLVTLPKINQKYEDQVDTSSDEEITSNHFVTESEIASKIWQQYEHQMNVLSNEEIISSQFDREFEKFTNRNVNQQYETNLDEEITLSLFDTKSEETIHSKIKQTYKDKIDITSNEEITYYQFYTEFGEAACRKVNKQNKVQGNISSEEEIRYSQCDIESEEFSLSKISQLYKDQVNIPSEEEKTSIHINSIPVELKNQYEDQSPIPSSVKTTTNQFDLKPKEITPQKRRLQYENIVKVDKSLDEDIISSHSDIESESNSENSSSEIETKSRSKILQRFRRKSVHTKRSLKILHHTRFLRKPHFRKSGDKKILKCVCVSLKLSKKSFKRNKKISETSVSDDGTCTEITSEEKSPPHLENALKEGISPNTAQVNMDDALNALLLMPSYLEKLESLNLVPVYNMKIEKSRLFHGIIENEADESFDSDVFDDDENYIEDTVCGVVENEGRNVSDETAAFPLSGNLKLEENETKIQANENPKKVKKKVRFKLDEEVITEKPVAKGKGCFPFMYLFPNH